MNTVTVHDVSEPSPQDLESYRLSLLTLYAALRSKTHDLLAEQRTVEPHSQAWFRLWDLAVAAGNLSDATALDLKEAMFTAGVHTLEITGWRARIVPAEHSRYWVSIVIERRI